MISLLYSKSSKFQKIELFESKEGVYLELNGEIQFHTADEKEMHEKFVKHAMDLSKTKSDILILGGGDGLALRDALECPKVNRVTLVELDKEMIDLFKTNEILSSLCKKSFDDNRATIVIDDAFKWMFDSKEKYDVIINDIEIIFSNSNVSLDYLIKFYKKQLESLSTGGVISVYCPINQENADLLECNINDLPDAINSKFLELSKNVKKEMLYSKYIGPHVYFYISNMPFC